MPIKFSFLFNSFNQGNNITFSGLLLKLNTFGCLWGIKYLLAVIFSIKTLSNKGNWGMMSQGKVKNKE